MMPVLIESSRCRPERRLRAKPCCSTWSTDSRAPRRKRTTRAQDRRAVRESSGEPARAADEAVFVPRAATASWDGRSRSSGRRSGTAPSRRSWLRRRRNRKARAPRGSERSPGLERYEPRDVPLRRHRTLSRTVGGTGAQETCQTVRGSGARRAPSPPRAPVDPRKSRVGSPASNARASPSRAISDDRALGIAPRSRSLVGQRRFTVPPKAISPASKVPSTARGRSDRDPRERTRPSICFGRSGRLTRPPGRRMGSPRIHEELRDAHEISVGRERVARLMPRAGVRGVHRHRLVKTTDRRKTAPCARSRGAIVRSGCAQSTQDRGHHAPSRVGWLRVPGGGPGYRESQGRGLVAEEPPPRRAGGPSARPGDRPASPGRGQDSSLGSRVNTSVASGSRCEEARVRSSMGSVRLAEARC